MVSEATSETIWNHQMCHSWTKFQCFVSPTCAGFNGMGSLWPMDRRTPWGPAQVDTLLPCAFWNKWPVLVGKKNGFEAPTPETKWIAGTQMTNNSNEHHWDVTHRNQLHIQQSGEKVSSLQHKIVLCSCKEPLRPLQHESQVWSSFLQSGYKLNLWGRYPPVNVYIDVEKPMVSWSSDQQLQFKKHIYI
jgi:hypothetical protein